MMKRALLWTSMLTLLAAGLAVPAAAGEHRLGVGVHYWRSLNQLSNDFPDIAIQDDGLSEVVSYQYLAGFIRFEADAEYFDKGFQGSTTRAVAPEVFILAGRGIYGGVGVGVTYADFAHGKWSDPFYIAKAGVDFLLLPKIHLDVNADYRFLKWKDIDNYNSDTITFGATVRVAF